MSKKLNVKYFICALGEINLAIPAEQTERIIPVARVQTSVMESETQEVFISLPVLFRQKDAAAPHGLVLKTEVKFSAAGFPGKTILLTPRIDIELEIPEENIHRLPEAFSGLFSCFKGACFAGNSQNMTLILDPEKLINMEDLK